MLPLLPKLPRGRARRKCFPSISSDSASSYSSSPSPPRVPVVAASNPSAAPPPPRQQSPSPPRVRVLHRRNYPLLGEVPQKSTAICSTTPSPPKKVKLELGVKTMLPEKKTEKVKEPLVDAVNGLQQKRYFVDRSLNEKVNPPRRLGHDILYTPAFHAVSKTLVDADRLGMFHSINQLMTEVQRSMAYPIKLRDRHQPLSNGCLLLFVLLINYVIFSSFQEKIIYW